MPVRTKSVLKTLSAKLSDEELAYHAADKERLAHSIQEAKVGKHKALKEVLANAKRKANA